jgi:hypothetical protein
MTSSEISNALTALFTGVTAFIAFLAYLHQRRLARRQPPELSLYLLPIAGSGEVTVSGHGEVLTVPGNSGWYQCHFGVLNRADVPLRCEGLCIPGANGRHAHEWRVWERVPLPEDKVLVAGVIDSTTNIIEHPEAVAERIGRYASVVGRERLIAGVDCGFGTVAGVDQVDTRIVWAKLRSLAEGAALASPGGW